jgi:GH24 family phage-related lysozyme (muramidase)
LHLPLIFKDSQTGYKTVLGSKLTKQILAGYNEPRSWVHKLSQPTAPFWSRDSNWGKDTRELIKGHEGVRNFVYKDTKNKWTTGVGHLIGDGSTEALEASNFSNIERRATGEPKSKILKKGELLTEVMVNELFAKDFEQHYDAAKESPGWYSATPLQKRALIDLTYNMGKWWNKRKEKNPSQLEWPKAVAALEKGDWEGGIAQLKYKDPSAREKGFSDYYKVRPERSEEIFRLLRERSNKDD